MENRARLLTAALAGLSLLLLVTVMFTPWGTTSDSSTTQMPGAFGFGGGTMRFDTEATVYFWEGEFSFNGNGDDFSWFDPDLDEDGLPDGVAMLRAGAILLTIALAGVLATLVLAGLGAVNERLDMPALITGAASTLVAVVGLVLFATGTNEFLDEFGGDTVFHVGLYLGLVAALAIAAAAVMPLVPLPEGGVQRADFD